MKSFATAPAWCPHESFARPGSCFSGPGRPSGLRFGQCRLLAAFNLLSGDAVLPRLEPLERFRLGYAERPAFDDLASESRLGRPTGIELRGMGLELTRLLGDRGLRKTCAVDCVVQGTTEVRKRLDGAVRRRLRAGRLLLAGKTPAQAAQAVGVARQTAYTWKAVLDEGGIDALRAIPAQGRPARHNTSLPQGGIELAYLPLYAPDLNPVEYLWAWLKRHALANFCTAS